MKSTEVSSVCTANVKGAYKENSIGKPLDEITIEIWDEEKWNKTYEQLEAEDIAAIMADIDF